MMLLLRAKDQLSQERRRAVPQLEWAKAVGVSESELKLEDGQELSFAEIGQKLDLSHERVRQCLQRAIFRLRRRHPFSLRSYLSG